MNVIYVIAPVAMLAVFASYMIPTNARLDAELTAQSVASAKQRDAELALQEQQRQVVVEEQKTRAAEQKRLQQEKADNARREQATRDQALKDNLDRARETRENLQLEIASLTAQSQALVALRDAASSAAHSAREALEIRRIERRTLDLELQRMTTVLAERIEHHEMAAGPSLFPVPERKRHEGTR